MITAAQQERVNGRVLAGVLFAHLILLGTSSAMTVATSLVLLAGAITRGWQIFLPDWLGRILVFAGAAGVVTVASFEWMRPVDTVGEMAGLTGAILLLRPVTPARGLKVIFCILIVLTTAILQPYVGLGTIFIILDVVFLLVLVEKIHRPPEAALSLWVSFLRSMRVVIPVAIVVSMIFWLFPNLSVYTTPAFTGFSGASVLNPGMIAELNQSRRIALVAHFSKTQPVPPPSALYWRGQVLESNQGLSWSRVGDRLDRLRTLQPTLPATGTEVWRYSQEMTSNRGGIVPALDHAVFVNATRAGQEVAVLDMGAAVLTAVGAGSLNLEVASTGDGMPDVPMPDIASGAQDVPKKIKTNAEILQITKDIVSPARSTVENLTALAKFLRDTGFTYTTRPGKMPDLTDFLLVQRKGFCEHYAAAAANILRLGGVPARVVTGYRGGEWNPWLRTITVRDSEAHAWVEAWDKTSRQWMRFDPTAYVAPELTTRLERGMNSELWPWYRTALSYATALWVSFTNWLQEIVDQLSASEALENLQPIAFGAFVLFGLVWLLRNYLRRRSSGFTAVASSLLEDLEARASRLGRKRHPGETPLAWLARLGAEAPTPAETKSLRQFARSYENGVYRADRQEVGDAIDLRNKARQLQQIWRAAGKIRIAAIPSHPARA